jgi:hypothetical protein
MAADTTKNGAEGRDINTALANLNKTGHDINGALTGLTQVGRDIHTALTNLTKADSMDPMEATEKR